MRLITPTLAICAVGAAFAAGALTAGPRSSSSPAPAAAAAPGTPADGDQTAELTIDAGPADNPVVSIEGFAFTGGTVPAGATVRVVNRDSVPHTVTADDGSFDVFVDGGSEATFTAPATLDSFSFFCGIHPSMHGVLTVA